jgi:DNA modification methylase
MSTAIACIESGRDYLVVEKDEGFFEQGLKRIAESVKVNGSER